MRAKVFAACSSITRWSRDKDSFRKSRRFAKNTGTGASEYARYLAKLKANPSLSFQYPGSVEYEGSEQLIRLGLLREAQGWTWIRTAGRDMEDIKDRATLSAAGSA